MKKKLYIIPQMEVSSIKTHSIMDSSMTFLPPQPGMAPKRPVPTVSNDSVRVF